MGAREVRRKPKVGDQGAGDAASGHEANFVTSDLSHGGASERKAPLVSEKAGNRSRKPAAPTRCRSDAVPGTTE
ncbi:MAG: hypothetical protein WC455_31305 [Dehalococcoidia bacterium]